MIKNDFPTTSFYHYFLFACILRILMEQYIAHYDTAMTPQETHVFILDIKARMKTDEVLRGFIERNVMYLCLDTPLKDILGAETLGLIDEGPFLVQKSTSGWNFLPEHWISQCPFINVLALILGPIDKVLTEALASLRTLFIGAPRQVLIVAALSVCGYINDAEVLSILTDGFCQLAPDCVGMEGRSAYCLMWWCLNINGKTIVVTRAIKNHRESAHLLAFDQCDVDTLTHFSTPVRI